MKPRTCEYAEWWLAHAQAQLAEEAASTLGDSTNPHIHDVSVWEEMMEEIYFTKPQTLEEGLLRMEIRQMFLVALENSLRRAEQKEYPPIWGVWAGIDLSEAYRLADIAAQVDELIAPGAMIRMNRIARRMGTSLYSLDQINFGLLIKPVGIRM